MAAAMVVSEKMSPQEATILFVVKVTGTFAAEGLYVFTVTVTDAAGQTADMRVAVDVARGLAILTETLPSSTVGAAYDVTLDAVGGTAPFSWELVEGPDWLTLDSGTGELSASELDPMGSYDVTVKVTDDVGQTYTASFILTVAEGEGCEEQTELEDYECAAASLVMQALGWVPSTIPFCGMGADFPVGDIACNEGRIVYWEIFDSGPPVDTIHPAIGRLTELVALHLLGTAISGPIPSEIENLSKLEDLEIGNTRLEGQLPEFGAFPNLSRLQIAGNANLSGPISDALLDLPIGWILIGNNGCFTTSPELAAWLDANSIWDWDDGCA